jgi:hypothetical protein
MPSQLGHAKNRNYANVSERSFKGLISVTLQKRDCYYFHFIKLIITITELVRTGGGFTLLGINSLSVIDFIFAGSRT